MAFVKGIRIGGLGRLTKSGKIDIVQSSPIPGDKNVSHSRSSHMSARWSLLTTALIMAMVAARAFGQSDPDRLPTDLDHTCREQCEPKISGDIYIARPRTPDDVRIDMTYTEGGFGEWQPRLYTHSGVGTMAWVWDLPVTDVMTWRAATKKYLRDRKFLGGEAACAVATLLEQLPFTYEKRGERTYHAVIRPEWKQVDTAARFVKGDMDRSPLRMQRGVAAEKETSSEDHFECDCEKWIRDSGWRLLTGLPRVRSIFFVHSDQLTPNTN